VSVPDRERGGQKTERLGVIDWEHPANNGFLLVSQFSVTGALYTCRPDLVGFVNGLPLVVIELKKPGVPARAALEQLNASRKGHHSLQPEAITVAKLFQLFPGH
jgi:type I restriction enzyme R subunit